MKEPCTLQDDTLETWLAFIKGRVCGAIPWAQSADQQDTRSMVMEQLLKTRDSYDGTRGTPAAWVNMLIKQAVRDYYKGRARQRSVSLEVEHEDIADVRHDSPGERVDLERLAAGLSTLDQQLLKDVLRDGLSFKDFARANHVSRKTVQRHIKCLRATLRSHL